MKKLFVRSMLVIALLLFGAASVNPAFAEDCEKVSVKITSQDVEMYDTTNEVVHPEREISLPPSMNFDYEITLLYKKAIR